MEVGLTEKKVDNPKLLGELAGLAEVFIVVGYDIDSIGAVSNGETGGLDQAEPPIRGASE